MKRFLVSTDPNESHDWAPVEADDAKSAAVEYWINQVCDPDLPVFVIAVSDCQKFTIEPIEHASKARR